MNRRRIITPATTITLERKDRQMNINDQEVSKLRALLEAYKEEHGTIAMGSAESTNCATCSGSCDNFCTNSCRTHCDGNSGSCWQSGHR
jgi:hypothetical protein